MSRDKKAVTVSKALGIPYGQALRLLREAHQANPELRFEELPDLLIAQHAATEDAKQA